MTNNSPAGVTSPPTNAPETPDPETTNPAVKVGKPQDLLAVIPKLLRFVPADSLVILGTDAPHGRVKLSLRYDLPDPPAPRVMADIVAHATGVLASQSIECAIAVGYGPARLVAPLASALRAHASVTGFTLMDMLRVEGGRYWSYLCQVPECCPPEGRQVPAEAEAAGSRDELAASVAAVVGAEADAAARATRKAERRAARLIARVGLTGRPAQGRRLLAAAGIQAVTETIGTYRKGRTVTRADQFAWLAVALRDLRVRDDAWARMDPEHRQAHLRMWTELTRQARPGYVAAPASLLAFVAWQCGNGALANVALDRAQADQPGYSMALLLRQAIGSGIPPSAARLPMTPEQVAASYDELDDEVSLPGGPA